MSGAGSILIGAAFLAGLLSFLSPCVLPIVPGYVTFITGLTIDELTVRGTAAARRQAAVHATLFVLGFGMVFVTLGATATALGVRIQRSLPLMQQVGGVVIALFGLTLLGVVRMPSLMRERRLHLAAKPAGMAGSMVAGIAFGAGWTPCVGPVLASILLYAGMEGSVARGMLLLGVYALGLGLPFWFAAVGLNWYLAGARRLSRWLRPIELVSGGLLVVMGVLLITGRFAALTGFLAGFGQLFTLEA